MNSGAVCQPLPGDVKNLVRSGNVISSFTQCVEELVYNSIDAESKQVHIKIDINSFDLHVEDDGKGLSIDNLEVVGTRYWTTKCSSVKDLERLQYYGYRGETLASVIEMSNSVEIIATIFHGFQTLKMTKLFEKGKRIGDLKSSVATSEYGGSTYEKGLSVKIQNVLGRYPVRQNRVDQSVVLEEIITSIQHISLMNTSVSFILEDSSTGKVIANIARRNSIIESFLSVFCDQNTIEKHSSSLVEEHYNYNAFFLTGCISTETHANKNLQLVFVNKRFVSRGKIHRHVQKLLIEALGFGKNYGINSETENKTRGTSPKGEKFAVFVINITCPVNYYDLVWGTKKYCVGFNDWDSVLKGCEGLILRFKAGMDSKNSLLGKKVIANFNETSKLGYHQEEKGSNLADIGKSICTWAHPRAMYSRVAVREDVNTDVLPTIRWSADSGRGCLPSADISPDADSIPQSSPRNSPRKSPRATKLVLAGRKAAKVHIPSLKRRSKNFQSSMPIKKKYTKKIQVPNLTAEHFKKVPEFKGYFDSSDNSTGFKTQLMYESSDSGSDMNEENTVGMHHDSTRGLNSSQDWASNLNLVKISSRREIDNKDLTVLPSDPVLTPVSHAIKKVGLWQEQLKLTKDDDVLAYTLCKATMKKYLESNDRSSSFNREVHIEALRKDVFTSAGCSVASLKAFITNRNNENETYDPFNQQDDTSCKRAAISQTQQSSFPLLPASSTDIPKWDTMDPLLLCVTQSKPPDLIKSIDAVQMLPTDLKTSDSVLNPDGKISALEAEKLNPPVKHNWLTSHFPYGASKFRKPEKRREVMNPFCQSKTSSPERSAGALGAHVLECIHGNTDTLTKNKWKDGQSYNDDGPGTSHTTNPRVRILDDWCAPLETEGIPVSHLYGSEANMLTRKNFVPTMFQFVKNDFKNLTFISQLDCKFLVTKILKSIDGHLTEMMVLFDQHAAHERVLLETLIDEMFTGTGIKTFETPAFNLKFSNTEVRILEKYKERFSAIGVMIEVSDPTTVIIYGAPNVLVVKAQLEANIVKQSISQSLAGLVHSLLDEQLRHFSDTNGVLQRIPKMIFDILCSNACHAAIKFGDRLEVKACQKLLYDLSNCKTPFQCAHGRPTVFPLLNLSEFQSVVDASNKATMESLWRPFSDQDQQFSSKAADDQVNYTSMYFTRKDTSPYF